MDALSTEYALWTNESSSVAIPMLLLLVTIVLETAGTLCLKMASSASGLGWLALAYGLYGGAFAIFPSVLKNMKMGQAYAVWSGAGCVFTAANGWVFFGEALSPRQIASSFLILMGVCGLLL